MGWSLQLGRIRGTAIRVHFTLLIFLAWYAWQGWRMAGPQGAIEQFLFLTLLFVSVTLHEFGHITAARRFGIATPDVILTPIGGIARIARMPEEPRQELIIALAGPLVTLVIAALISGVLLATGGVTALLPSSIADVPLWTALAWTNIILLLFNLLPAFPMDGGRVLRALLAGRLGMVRATRIAARVGQALAIGFVILGLQGNPMLVLIAVFVFLGAEAEYGTVRGAGRAPRGTAASSLAGRELNWASEGQSMRDLLWKAGDHPRSGWPVLDATGRLVGRIEHATLLGAAAAGQLDTAVGSAMLAIDPSHLIPANLAADQAIQRLLESGESALPIVDDAGRLLGMLNRDQITELINKAQPRP